MSMTRAEMQKLHVELCQSARDLQTKKNSDYATEKDIFRNFRMFGTLGVIVRLSDKLARLRTFEENGTFVVSDEKLRDTIEDIINYAVIYYAMKAPDVPLAVVSSPGLNNISDRVFYAKPKIKDGPCCEDCGKLADFRTAEGVCWCAPCANWRSLDTNQMYVLGR